MQRKAFWLPAIVAFAVLAVLDFVIHSLILRGDYATTGLVRSPVNVPLILVGEFVFAVLFTWIYTKGYEPSKPPVGQGVRYGLALGLLYWGAGSLIHLAVIPVSGALAVKWIVFGVIEMAIVGAVVASLYKPAAEVAA